MKRLALALPVLLLAAACGGSDQDQVAGGLSKADYLTQSEAICRQANTDQKAVTFPTSTAALPAYVKQLLDLAEKTDQDLEALEPPAADKVEIRAKVLTPLKEQLGLAKTYYGEVKAAVQANDQKKLGQLIGNPPTGTKADLDWMRAYGFKECVDAADTSG
jgi:hypothetical protein